MAVPKHTEYPQAKPAPIHRARGSALRLEGTEKVQMTMKQIDAYLERIGYSGPREVSVATLKQLHLAHMLSVPFENLDIHLGHPIAVSLPSLYEKIVQRRRGGFCYELNGLFGWLLVELGFKVAMLSARVFNGSQPGPEFDHMILLVKLEEHLIADVGFGDSFLEPLWLNTHETVLQYGSSYRLVGSEPAMVLERRRDSDWESQYVFSLVPRRLAEFSAMCHHHQTSPESHFTQKAVCSMATTNGRITLANGRLIMTTAAQREVLEVTSEEEYQSHLKVHFGITLGEGERTDRLMHRGCSF